MTEAQQQSLADLGIGFSVITPKDEPGKKYALLKDFGSEYTEDVLDLTKQNRKTHPGEETWIWVNQVGNYLVVYSVEARK